MKWGILIFVLPTLFALTWGSAPRGGGSTEVDIKENKGAQKALKAAVEEHNKRSNTIYLAKVLEVKKAEVQVVSGLLYKITVIMAKTPCRKDQTPGMCSFYEDPKLAQPYQCTFNVWSRPWLKNPTEVHQDCS